MAATFNMLRANDLIWSFVVNNYLLGKEPFPFDLLYWNSDSTRMPAAMHSFYLRNMYQENLLVAAGRDQPAGRADRSAQGQDAGLLALDARRPHRALAHRPMPRPQLYAGPVRFVLAASGHIAGVVNPPGSTKYGYWTNEAPPADPDAWLAGAQAARGLVVAGLGRVGQGVCRRQGEGAQRRGPAS